MSFKSSSYVPDTTFLSDVYFEDTFGQPAASLFILSPGFTHRANVFNLDEVQFTTSYFLWNVTFVASLTLCVAIDPEDFFPFLFQKVFITLHFTFKFMIYIEFISV